MRNRLMFWRPLKYCFFGEWCGKDHDVDKEHKVRV